MGPRYLIDSNVIIDYIANLLPPSGDEFVEAIFNGDFLISIVVKIEVLGYDGSPREMTKLEEFIDTASILTLDGDIVSKTIALKRKHKKLKLGDSAIAATALVNDLILVSRNLDDFKNIDGLLTIDPWKK